MSFMRVLWLINCRLSNDDAMGTGSWLSPMLEGMQQDGTLFSVIAASPVSRFERRDRGKVPQWLVPIRERLGFDGLPSQRTLRDIAHIVDSLNPDLVHVWGTEFYWGLLTVRSIVKRPSLLTIQGIRYRIAPRYYGDLTVIQRLRTVGSREFVKWLFGRNTYRWLKNAERFEREILGGHSTVCVHSPWQAAQVLSCNPQARIQHIDLPLRPAFWSHLWNGNCRPVLFASSSSPSPAKGLHVLFRAVAILKKSFPDVQLRIAGLSPAISGSVGYMKWLFHEAERCNIERNIIWLGKLGGEQLAEELSEAAVCVQPTFIESYSMAMAEAMAVGAPIVATYTGGTSYLGKDEENCLFFPLGDDAMCAYQIRRILDDAALAARLSANARGTAMERHRLDVLVAKQRAAYEQVLAEASP